MFLIFGRNGPQKNAYGRHQNKHQNGQKRREKINWTRYVMRHMSHIRCHGCSCLSWPRPINNESQTPKKKICARLYNIFFDRVALSIICAFVCMSAKRFLDDYDDDNNDIGEDNRNKDDHKKLSQGSQPHQGRQLFIIICFIFFILIIIS